MHINNLWQMDAPTTIVLGPLWAGLRTDRASPCLLPGPVLTRTGHVYERLTAGLTGDQRLTSHDAPTCVELQSSRLQTISTEHEG